jgi:hypothetical protein
VTTSARPTRSLVKTKAAPKLKLKLSEKAAVLAPDMSFLGPYDRELDSDEELLLFEEQFILLMPPGEDRGKLREMAAARGISLDFWFMLKGTLSQHAFSKHMTDYFEQTHVALSSTQGTICIQRYLPVWPTVCF